MRAMSCLCPLVIFPVLAGCVMGPNFDRAPPPPSSMGKAFVRSDMYRAVPATHLAPWWKSLEDPLLDQLITRAFATSPTVDIARARVRQARFQLRSARASLAPVVGAAAGAGDVRAPAFVTGSDARSSSLFVSGFDALWEIDLFGGRQRSIEAAAAQFGAAEADAEDIRLSLTAEIARHYIALREVQGRLDLARRALANQQKITELTEQLEAAGKISRIEREQAERMLEIRRLALTSLDAEQNDQRDAIAVLIGEAPGAVDALLEAPSHMPLPPAEVSVGDPGSMIARRPDVRAAEERLRAANAAIGVAQAARMPKVSLAGIIGLGGAMKGDMTSSDNLFSLAGPTLQWNVADFGRGNATVNQVKAGHDEAEAGYRSVVLGALQDAERSLNHFGEARKTLAIETRNSVSSHRVAELARQSWRADRSSSLSALMAENEELAASERLLQAQAALSMSYVALQKALAMGISGE